MSKVRPTKIEYYLSIAKVVSSRSTCLVSNYGSVIVKQDRIVSTGYNGSGRGTPNCCDLGYCSRDVDKDNPRYNDCRAVHSEASAIIFASYSDLVGASLYIARGLTSPTSHKEVSPCMACRRLILNSQIENIFCLQTDNSILEFNPKSWIC